VILPQEEEDGQLYIRGEKMEVLISLIETVKHEDGFGDL